MGWFLELMSGYNRVKLGSGQPSWNLYWIAPLA